MAPAFRRVPSKHTDSGGRRAHRAPERGRDRMRARRRHAGLAAAPHAEGVARVRPQTGDATHRVGPGVDGLPDEVRRNGNVNIGGRCALIRGRGNVMGGSSSVGRVCGCFKRQRSRRSERGGKHDAFEREGRDGGAATQCRWRFAPPHEQRGRCELRDFGRRGVRQRHWATETNAQ